MILEENEAIAHETASTILGQASGRLFGKHPTLISGKPPPFLHFSFLPPPPSPFYCILGLDTAPRPKFWPRKKGVQSLKFQTEVHARFIGLRSSGGLAGTISPTPQPLSFSSDLANLQRRKDPEPSIYCKWLTTRNLTMYNSCCTFFKWGVTRGPQRYVLTGDQADAAQPVVLKPKQRFVSSFQEKQTQFLLCH